MAHFFSPVREQLRAEMLACLANAQSPMTSSALYQACPSATSSEDVARVAYELKRKGMIADGGKVIHPLGMPVNSYILSDPTDPRIEAAKPIKVEPTIKKSRPPAIKRKPPKGHPFAASIRPQEAHDGLPRVTRPLPTHLQSTAPHDAFPAVSPVAQTTTAPQMAAESINHYLEDHIMSEDPIHYADPEPFALEPREPEAEEDVDSELVSALLDLAHMNVIEADSADDLMAKMVPLPMATDMAEPESHMISDSTLAFVHAMAEEDDDVLAMASTDVGEIAAAMSKRHESAPKKVCKCLRINSLPKLPVGYRYAAISVDIVSDEDGESLNLLIADEGNGPFAQIDTTGKLRFDLGELALISQAADALIKLLESDHA